ncbi:hypothetical protein [Kitasatospora kifunensis]|uniref:Uncharacterized protein n=1 Tax=Kitasatospora kifunensis TaxID=58351 RepID=A0A7W7R9M8_KITKI|nr:hypothetical protein [Kitasatospora kifunensis]MBB4927936.1 hypothetical protein [Kitasatospora kifunensis]
MSPTTLDIPRTLNEDAFDLDVREILDTDRAATDTQEDNNTYALLCVQSVLIYCLTAGVNCGNG